MQQNLPQQNEFEQMDAELKKIMIQLLTPEAMSRMAMIKSTRPDFAMQVQVYILQQYQAGMIRGQVTDEMLKNILDKIVQKPKWNINVKRK